jgi:SAM-dependent methyltransferase
LKEAFNSAFEGCDAGGVSLGPPEDPTLRTTFDAVAEAYDGVRPPLPEDLIDDVVELAHLPARGRVLEIGCGTGSATVAFAERGYEVVAVELGDGLATVARRNLAPFPNARVDTAAFEQWRLPDERFDLVTAFHAWHWLDPAVALDKAARALRPAGPLAIVGGTHVAGGDTAFFDGVQDSTNSSCRARRRGYAYNPPPTSRATTGVPRPPTSSTPRSIAGGCR